jgi:hypothetical protein
VVQGDDPAALLRSLGRVPAREAEVALAQDCPEQGAAVGRRPAISATSWECRNHFDRAAPRRCRRLGPEQAAEARSFLVLVHGREAVDQEPNGPESRLAVAVFAPAVGFAQAPEAAVSSGVLATGARAAGPAASTTAFTSAPTG